MRDLESKLRTFRGNPSQASPLDMQDPNLVTIISADFLHQTVLTIAGPAMIIDLDIFVLDINVVSGLQAISIYNDQPNCIHQHLWCVINVTHHKLSHAYFSQL